MLGTIATCLGLVSGIIPDFTQQPSAYFGSSARADEFSDADLRNYAAALMEIEPIRQSILAQVRAINGDPLPNLRCDQPSTMDSLKSEAKSLFVDYCKQCGDIVARKGISDKFFNQITQSVRSNPQLQSRVRSFMN